MLKLAEVAITSGGCHIPLYFPTDPVISWIELVFAVLTESFSISIPRPSNNSIPHSLATWVCIYAYNHISIKSDYDTEGGTNNIPVETQQSNGACPFGLTYVTSRVWQLHSIIEVGQSGGFHGA